MSSFFVLGCLLTLNEDLNITHILERHYHQKGLIFFFSLGGGQGGY